VGLESQGDVCRERSLWAEWHESMAVQDGGIDSDIIICYPSKKMPKFTLLLLSILCVGCPEPHDPNVLERQRFIEIYTQILKEHAKWSPPITDSTRADSIAQAISEASGATIQQFKATVLKYRTDPKYWSEFYLDVTKRLEGEERKKIDAELR